MLTQLPSDTLGRVCILESRSLVVLRVWKGYRDAQCAWTCESVPWASGGAHVERRSLFVIYAPRRGLLEVWRAPLGGRLQAFSVGPGCILLSPSPPVRDSKAPQQEDDLSNRRHHCYILQPNGAIMLVVGSPESTKDPKMSKLEGTTAARDRSKNTAM